MQTKEPALRKLCTAPELPGIPAWLDRHPARKRKKVAEKTALVLLFHHRDPRSESIYPATHRQGYLGRTLRIRTMGNRSAYLRGRYPPIRFSPQYLWRP